jgi:NodT family efflux transporter outer membrane factor (OMF) lipoprotein
MRSAPILALAAALLVSACATVPDLGARPLPRANGVTDQKAFAAPTADWPREDWWRAYGDPQLDALISQGLKDAPTMALAQARLRRADALVGQASAAALPSLAANLAISESKPSDNTGLPVPPALRGWNDNARATLDFTYEFDFWGKTRSAVAAATSETAAAEADLAAARLVVSTSIAAAYAELARLHADRDVLQQSRKVREQTLAIARRRFENGSDGEAEVRQAEAGPLLSQAEEAAVGEQMALTRLRIAALMGAPPDRAADIAPPGPVQLAAFGLPDNLPAQLLGRRPDLVAARWLAQAASDRIDQAHAQFYPNVNLIGLIGGQALGIGNLTAAGSDLGAIGPAISLPIFDGGRRAAGYRVARADYDASVAAYDASLITALEEVADVATSEHALDQRLKSSRAALAASTRGWELARRRYEAGASDYPSVLLAEDRMLAGRRIVAGLEARRFILDLALVRALGGGWREEARGD